MQPPQSDGPPAQAPPPEPTGATASCHLDLTRLAAPALLKENRDEFTAFPVSYQDDYGVWKDVEPLLRACLPLHNLNWKRKTGPQYLLGSLDVHFSAWDSPALNWASFSPLGSPMVNFYRKPYLYLFLVVCDDNDLYREAIKPKLAQWSANHQEKGQEWLIVHVQGKQSLRTTLNSAFNRSPFDKIKDDFKRVLQVRLSDKDDKKREAADAWTAKLTEYLLLALDQRVLEYEEEIRKVQQRRMVIGWNYCSFFLVKEALAIVYEAASLLDDALLQYTELEVLFNEEVNGKRPNRMDRFFPPASDAAELCRPALVGALEPAKRPYRELLSKNTITEFEFLEYLFSRQLKLLFGLDRISDVIARALVFVRDMDRAFKQHRAELPDAFADTWCYCACLDLVEKCTAWYDANPQLTHNGPTPPSSSGSSPSSSSAPSPSTPSALRTPTSAPLPPSPSSFAPELGEVAITSLSIALADLYYYARLKLDRLGAGAKFLPESRRPKVNMVRLNALSTAAPDPHAGAAERTPEARRAMGQSGDKEAHGHEDSLAFSVDLGRSDDSQALAAAADAAATAEPAVRRNSAAAMRVSDGDKAKDNGSSGVRSGSDPGQPPFGSEAQKPPAATAQQPPSVTPTPTLSPATPGSAPPAPAASSPAVPPAPAVVVVSAPPSDSPDPHRLPPRPIEPAGPSRRRDVSPWRGRRPVELRVSTAGTQLQAILRSRDDFDRVYIELSQKAAFRYKEAFRFRHVVLVNNDVATLLIQRGRPEDAEALLKGISHMYASEGWHTLNLFALALLADCQRFLSHHLEYISTCLGILATPIDAHAERGKEALEVVRFYQQELVHIATKLLQQPLCRDMMPVFRASFEAPRKASFIVGETVSYDCTLETLLPDDLPLNAVQLKFIERPLSLPSSPVSLRTSSDGAPTALVPKVLLIEQRGTTLKAGSPTRLRLSKRLVEAGDFLCDRIILQLGSLSLTQPLREHPLGFASLQSHPSMEISVAHSDDERHVLGQQQALTVVVKTNSDSVHSGSLVISFLKPGASGKALALIPYFVREKIRENPYFLQHSSKEGPESAKRVPFVLAEPAEGDASSVTLQILDVAPGHVMRFEIPIKTDLSTTAENAAFTREISCKLLYQKVPDGKYEVEVIDELRFLPPFTCSQSALPHPGDSRRLFLHCIFRNNLWKPVSIAAYKLSLGPSCRLLHDPSQAVVLNQFVQPRQDLALCFLLELLESSESAASDSPPSIWLEYRLVDAGSPAPFIQPLSLPSAPAQIEYDLATFHPRHARIACFFPLEFAITRRATGAMSSEPVQLRYEIACEPKEWVVSGRKKHSFALRPGETARFVCKVMAVKSGYLPLPQFTLGNTPRSRILTLYHARQIFIFPLAHRSLVEISHQKSH